MKTRNFEEDNKLKDKIKNLLLGLLILSNGAMFWVVADNKKIMDKQNSMIFEYQRAESVRLEEVRKENDIKASEIKTINPKNIVYKFSNDNKDLDIDITDTGINCDSQEPYVNILKEAYPNAKIINRNCDNK